MVEDLGGLALHLVGHPLHVGGAAQRVGNVGHAGLMSDDLLGAKGDTGRPLRRQGQGLVVGVGVQRLGAAESRGQGLQRHPGDVVLRLLGGERHAGRSECGTGTSGCAPDAAP